jgi:hypothetical protein
MKTNAAFSVLTHLSEQPFWLGREFVREKSALLQAAGLPNLARFHPPPLPVAYGPGTAYPRGVKVAGLRQTRD